MSTKRRKRKQYQFFMRFLNLLVFECHSEISNRIEENKMRFFYSTFRQQLGKNLQTRIENVATIGFQYSQKEFCIILWLRPRKL